MCVCERARVLKYTVAVVVFSGRRTLSCGGECDRFNPEDLEVRLPVFFFYLSIRKKKISR